MTDLCTECQQPLEDDDEVQRALDGSGTHQHCVEELLERLDAQAEEGDE